MHERSQKHIRNRDRENKWLSRHNKKEKTEEEKYEEEVKYMNEVSYFILFHFKSKAK